MFRGNWHRQSKQQNLRHVANVHCHSIYSLYSLHCNIFKFILQCNYTCQWFFLVLCNIIMVYFLPSSLDVYFNPDLDLVMSSWHSFLCSGEVTDNLAWQTDKVLQNEIKTFDTLSCWSCNLELHKQGKGGVAMKKLLSSGSNSTNTTGLSVVQYLTHVHQSLCP
jgi:hypothetical protein